MSKVVFASTGYGPLWAPAVSSWLACIAHTANNLVTMTTAGKISGAGITDRMYTHSAENTLVKDFLNIPDATHLFFTEMDMLLPEDAILKLLEMDVDIASGIYFLRNGGGQPCLYKKLITTKGNQYMHTPVSMFPQDEPFRIDCPGFGCVLFKRSVFETLAFPWFDLKEVGYGSDMFFYTNARNAGIEVWATPKVMCGQIDYTVVTLDDYRQRLETDPDFTKTGCIIGMSEQREAQLRGASSPTDPAAV